jgi:hypothetical protein
MYCPDFAICASKVVDPAKKVDPAKLDAAKGGAK